MKRLTHVIIRITLLLLIYAVASAQTLAIKGIIVDDNGKRIPYCAIEDTTNNTGFFADQYGNFELKLNADTIKSLKFYAMGYVQKDIILKKLVGSNTDSLVIQLDKNVVGLKDVSILSKKVRTKERVLGKRNLRPAGAYYMKYGYEVALGLQTNNEYRESYLKQVFFYITDEGAPRSKFKVNIYKEDTAWMLPGEKLAGDIVANGTTGNEWVCVDVSNMRIPIVGMIFIGMEWIKEGNSDSEYEYKFPKDWCSSICKTDEEMLQEGQVLGSSLDYGILSGAYTINHNGADKWTYTQSPYNKTRDCWLCAADHWFNPMIYCTYTYSKK